MQAPRIAGLIGLLAPLLGCTPSFDTGTIVDDVLIDPPRRAERPLRQALGPNGRHAIFVNFDGVKLTPNYDDSTRNESSIAGSIGRTITVPPFDPLDYDKVKGRDTVIADVMVLTRKYFAAYDVDVVTTRPMGGNYVMAAVGGLPDLIGQPCRNGGCIGGIAPLDCQRSGNQILYNQQDDIEVVFAFAATARNFGQAYAKKVEVLAVTIAQETAHAYGLGHSDNKLDIMYPQTTGSTTGFLTGNYADSNNCARGVGTQDAHALLLKILGPRMGMTDATAPTVTITAPAAGATVPKTFTVTIDASDDVGVATLEVALSGAGAPTSREIAGPPYQTQFTVTSDGAWTITARATDAAGNVGTATRAVTVKEGSLLPFGAKCTASSQCQSGLCGNGSGGLVCTQACGACPMGYRCNAGKVCEAGSGMSMPSPGAVGADCAAPTDCKAGICAELAGRHFCTGPCKLDDESSCPPGMICSDFGADGLLCSFPVGRGGASSCAVARQPLRGERAPASPWALALLLLLTAPRLRRRR